MLPNLRPSKELMEKWWGDSPYQFTNSDPHPSEYVADRFHEWVSNELKNYLDKQQAKVDVLVDALTQASWRLSEYAAGHPHHNTDELVREINKLLLSKIEDSSNILRYKSSTHSGPEMTVIKPLYKVFVNSNDGGFYVGYHIIGYFSNEQVAKGEAKGKGPYGDDATIEVVNSVEVNGETYLLAENGKPVDVDLEKARSDAKLKEETLASLTDEQKRVLGLSD
jgi:hypothetical protein